MKSTRRVNSSAANSNVLVDDSAQENDEERTVMDNSKKSMSKEMDGMKCTNQRNIAL